MHHCPLVVPNEDVIHMSMFCIFWQEVWYTVMLSHYSQDFWMTIAPENKTNVHYVSIILNMLLTKVTKFAITNTACN